jgi:hypothetical protein
MDLIGTADDIIEGRRLLEVGVTRLWPVVSSQQYH